MSTLATSASAYVGDLRDKSTKSTDLPLVPNGS